MLASADAVFLKERRRRTSRSVGSSVLQKQCLCSSRPEFRTVAQRRRSLNLPVVRQQRRRANALVTEAPSSALPRVQPPAGPSIWEVVFSRELGFPFLAAPAAGFAYPIVCTVFAEWLEGTQIEEAVTGYWSTTVGLLFSFAISNAFYFEFAQMESIYDAIYKEAAAVNRVLEEAECGLAPDDAAFVAARVRDHILIGSWAHQADTTPAEALAFEIVSTDDPLEALTRFAMRPDIAAATPDLLQSIHDVRYALTCRLSANQRKFNGATTLYLKVLAVLTVAAQPLIHVVSNSPRQTVAEAWLFAFLTGVVSVCIAVTDDLSNPNDGLYTVTPVRKTLTAALLCKSDVIMAKGEM